MEAHIKKAIKNFVAEMRKKCYIDNTTVQKLEVVKVLVPNNFLTVLSKKKDWGCNRQMEHIMCLNENIPNIGLKFRTTTEGEEIKLVREFIDFYIYKFKKVNKKKNLAIFIEPKVESGFPDIVFAKYDPNIIIENWNDKRKQLVTNDLKLLSQLLYSRGCSGEYLLNCLKLSEGQTLESLERLLDANMIVRKNGVWRAQNLKKFYSIEKLISVEAKMCDMKKVLEQSLKNTWFASQSYILTGTNHPQKDTILNIRKQGVGLYCKDEGFKKIIEAKKMSLPSSYLSLQFNEWIGNAII